MTKRKNPKIKILEKAFLDMLTNSGYPGVKFNKKIDFEKLYNLRKAQ